MMESFRSDVILNATSTIKNHHASLQKVSWKVAIKFGAGIDDFQFSFFF